MKQTSVGRLRGRSSNHYQAEPRPGTRLRVAWDLLQAHRGQLISYPFRSEIIKNLRHSYGLDVRNYGYHEWCLVGEWLADATYVDYVAQRAHEGEPKDD